MKYEKEYYRCLQMQNGDTKIKTQILMIFLNCAQRLPTHRQSFSQITANNIAN